jgi:hypothetical protein
MLLQPFANDAQLLMPFKKDPLFSEVARKNLTQDFKVLQCFGGH